MWEVEIKNVSRHEVVKELLQRIIDIMIDFEEDEVELTVWYEKE